MWRMQCKQSEMMYILWVHKRHKLYHIVSHLWHANRLNQILNSRFLNYSYYLIFWSEQWSAVAAEQPAVELHSGSRLILNCLSNKHFLLSLATANKQNASITVFMKCKCVKTSRLCMWHEASELIDRFATAAADGLVCVILAKHIFLSLFYHHQVHVVHLIYREGTK